MLFACWFMQRENISEMRSFSWVCMIHPGLFDLVKSLWFTERGTKSATLMWGRNAIHSAHYRKQMLHFNGVLMPTQSVVAESQLIWAASLGGEKKGALYLDEARIDSLQWVSKPTWLWPTSLHKLWVYIGAEHNACGAEIVGFFAQVHSVTRLSTSELAPHSHKFFASRLLSQVSRSLSCAAG